MGSGNLRWNPTFVPYQLCDLGQVISLLTALRKRLMFLFLSVVERIAGDDVCMQSPLLCQVYVSTQEILAKSVAEPACDTRKILLTATVSFPPTSRLYFGCRLLEFCLWVVILSACLSSSSSLPNRTGSGWVMGFSVVPRASQ